MYVLTKQHTLVNLDLCPIVCETPSYDNTGYMIQASTPDGKDAITLAWFRRDQECVARDVFDQFLFALSHATSEHDVIDLEQISKKALYEYDNGKVYEG